MHGIAEEVECTVEPRKWSAWHSRGSGVHGRAKEVSAWHSRCGVHGRAEEVECMV